MASISLNYSINSSHINDFYSSTNEYWIKLYNIYGNYFNNLDSCQSGNSITFYGRIFGDNTWKNIGNCSAFDYYKSPCYQYCLWDFIYARYYNFNNPNDEDNGKYIDKIAITYLGFRVESFINRCFINITTIDNYNKPLSNVKILDTPIITEPNPYFIAFTIENGGEKICTPICSDPSFTDLTKILQDCNNNEISLMQSQKENDAIYILTDGIPNKLIFTILTAGVYSGTLHFQYWNGLKWEYFPESIIDNTNGFRKSGINTVELPHVTDWKKRTVSKTTYPSYITRAIFDSPLNVTIVPKASCLKWKGTYDNITNEFGKYNFNLFTSGGKNINIPGILPGYIPLTGHGNIIINEATPNKDIIVTLVKSELNNNITHPSRIYKHQSVDILISSTVNVGNVSNILTITSPTNEISTFNPQQGIDIPITYTFIHEGLYKIQLTSKDDGENNLTKTNYIDVILPSSCNDLNDKESCELNNCYWTGDKCISENPHDILDNIYDSIINNTICLPTECIDDLDLDNDGLITTTDKDLSNSLTYNETLSKISNYQICKDLYQCSKPNETSKNIIIGAAIASGLYLYSKKKNKK